MPHIDVINETEGVMVMTKSSDRSSELGEPGTSPVPRIGEIVEVDFGGGYQPSGRVDGYYKTYHYQRAQCASTVHARIMHKLEQRLAAKRAPGAVRIVRCMPGKAEFVCAGTIIARVEDCVVTGVVGWDIEHILKEREDYAVFKNEIPDEIDSYWLSYDFKSARAKNKAGYRKGALS